MRHTKLSFFLKKIRIFFFKSTGYSYIQDPGIHSFLWRIIGGEVLKRTKSAILTLIAAHYFLDLSLVVGLLRATKPLHFEQKSKLDIELDNSTSGPEEKLNNAH